MTTEALACLMFGFVALCGAVGLAYWGREAWVQNQLRERGVTTVAQITRLKWSDPAGDGIQRDKDYYYVEYQYTINGISYTRQDRISMNLFNTLQEGQQIEVVYLPDNYAHARRASTL